ncbi:hypothetical protein ACQV5M_20215, partial [Leptospira sp. SA-E8]|uniref:hypothetical protein n=1 Tax=Leptospira sp. SA-E8 TaxID=3422259 RepID=UPI003EBFAAEA
DGEPPDEPMEEEDYYNEEDYEGQEAGSIPEGTDAAGTHESGDAATQKEGSPTGTPVERDTRVPGKMPGTPTVPLDLRVPGLPIIK